MATLKRTVVLTDPSGSTVTILPDTRVPKWAEKLITNPNVWKGRPPSGSGTPEGDVDDDPDEVSDTGEETTPPAAVVSAPMSEAENAAESAADDVPGDGGQSEVGAAVPPKSGPAGSRQKWADYAAAHGVEVESSWKRDDIVGACERAGVPTE